MSTGAITNNKMDTIIRDEITKILLRNGVNPRQKGFHYLRTAAEFVHKDPSYISCLTKRLYPDIAEKFGSTASRVERAIRHSIESMFSTTKPGNIDSFITVQIDITRGKVTNGTFIALLDLILEKQLQDLANGGAMQEAEHYAN